MKQEYNLSEKQQFLLDFWHDKASPEGWVDKSHVCLQALSKISPNLILLKSVGNDAWEFTLVGTGIVEEYCQDFTGCLIDDIPFDQCKTLYQETMNHSRSAVVPHIIQGDFCYDKNGFLQANEVSIPVSDNGEGVTHVLIVCDIKRGQEIRSLYTPDKPNEFSYEISPYRR